MAAVQKRNGSFRVLFRYLGKQYTFTLGSVTRAEADTKAGQVDYLLLRIKQGFVQLPAGISITEFIEKDGQIKSPENAVAAPEPITLAQLKERYLETHGNGAKEASSFKTKAMHPGHICRPLGDGFLAQNLALADLQRHVNERCQATCIPCPSGFPSWTQPSCTPSPGRGRACRRWSAPTRSSTGTRPRRRTGWMRA
jgi:hypothetical protein